MNKLQQSFFKKLISANTGVSSKAFFLVIVTLVGTLLLLIPAVILLVEIFYNHTIATDLTGLAAYIGAVASLFATAGITKAWSEKYEKCSGAEESSDENELERLKQFQTV